VLGEDYHAYSTMEWDIFTVPPQPLGAENNVSIERKLNISTTELEVINVQIKILKNVCKRLIENVARLCDQSNYFIIFAHWAT